MNSVKKINNIFDLIDSNFSNYKWEFDDFDFHINRNVISNRITDDDKNKVLINVIGHEPKNIKVSSAGDYVKVKAETEESDIAKTLDMKFLVGKGFDSNKVDAEVKNGVLTLLIDRKDDMKDKDIRVRF